MPKAYRHFFLNLSSRIYRLLFHWSTGLKTHPVKHRRRKEKDPFFNRLRDKAKPEARLQMYG